MGHSFSAYRIFGKVQWIPELGFVLNCLFCLLLFKAFSCVVVPDAVAHFGMSMIIVQLEKWETSGGPALWLVCLVIFVIAWIGQFIGHKIEGKKPSFLDDVKFLLIGPIWLLQYI